MAKSYSPWLAGSKTESSMAEMHDTRKAVHVMVTIKQKQRGGAKEVDISI